MLKYTVTTGYNDYVFATVDAVADNGSSALTFAEVAARHLSVEDGNAKVTIEIEYIPDKKADDDF